MPKSKSKPVDPHCPKKPLSSYFLFLHDRRPVFKEKMKGQPASVLQKAMAAEWNGLAEAEKKVYSDRAAAESAKYKTEFAEYSKTEHFEEHQERLRRWKEERESTKKPKGRRPRKPKKPDSHPKHPLTSYMVFGNERRGHLKQQYPDKKITELATLISAEWKTTSSDDRKRYERQSKALKEQYPAKMDAFAQTEEGRRYIEDLKAYKIAKKDYESGLSLTLLMITQPLNPWTVPHDHRVSHECRYHHFLERIS